MLGVTRLTAGGIRRRQLAAEEEDDDVDALDVPALEGVLLAAGLPSPLDELSLEEPELSLLAPLSGLELVAPLLLLSSPLPDPGLP